jgi:hypothetical protein
MRKKPKRTRTSRSPARRVGYDGSGHLAAGEARYLLKLAHATRSSEDDEAFVTSTATDDDLAEELAEAAVTSMTTGQDELVDELEVDVAEDSGGPFVETSGSVEFAGGTDESNIEEATREPFPTPNGVDKP